jgi:hypothetical protein
MSEISSDAHWLFIIPIWVSSSLLAHKSSAACCFSRRSPQNFNLSNRSKNFLLCPNKLRIRTSSPQLSHAKMQACSTCQKSRFIPNNIVISSFIIKARTSDEKFFSDPISGNVPSTPSFSHQQARQ